MFTHTPVDNVNMLITLSIVGPAAFRPNVDCLGRWTGTQQDTMIHVEHISYNELSLDIREPSCYNAPHTQRDPCHDQA